MNMNSLKSFEKFLIFHRFINFSKSFKHFSTKYLFNIKRTNDLLLINEFNFKSGLISRSFHSIPLSIYKSIDKTNNIQMDSNIKRKFEENENEIAFKVIELTLSHENENLSSKLDNNSNEIYNEFMKTLKSSESYPSIENLNNLNTNQLTNILEMMTLRPIITNSFEPKFYKLWSTLDEELTKRLAEVSFEDKKVCEQNLKIANLWVKLKIAKFGKFNNLLVKKLSSPDLQLNKTQFLHLMFYLNLHRKIDEKTKPFILNQLKSLIEKMSLDEIGIICMAFFKTQTKLSGDLVRFITTKVVNDISNQTNNIIKSSILKAIRFSYHFSYKEDVKSLIDRSKQFDNNSEITLSHLISLTNEAAIYDKTLFDDTFSKLHQNPSAFRAKDIERLLLSFANFNHKFDLNKLEPICKHIETSEDIAQYPWFLLSILYHMCLMEYFPKLLIERCFQPTFLDKIQNTARMDFRRNLLTVNTTLSIERYPQFGHLLLTTHRINRLHRRVLYQEKTASVIKSKKTLLINSVYLSLKSEFSSKVQLCHIFPFNSYPFIILSNDNMEKFSFSATTELRENMFNNYTVIYILNFNDYVDSQKIVRGINVLEIRLLKRLGFKLLTIPWHELICYKTSNGRKNKILSEIQKLT